jgi:hypothetical protein
VEPDNTTPIGRVKKSKGNIDLARLEAFCSEHRERIPCGILEGMAELASCRGCLRGIRITFEPPFLRHFTARFEPIG